MNRTPSATKVGTGGTASPAAPNTRIAPLNGHAAAGNASPEKQARRASAKKADAETVDVFSPRTEVALAHAEVRAQRAAQARELEEIQRSKEEEQHAREAEFEAARMAESRRIDAEILRTQKEQLKREDDELISKMVAQLKEAGITRESGLSKEDLAALQADRARRAAEAEQAKKERMRRRSSGGLLKDTHVNDHAAEAHHSENKRTSATRPLDCAHSDAAHLPSLAHSSSAASSSSSLLEPSSTSNGGGSKSRSHTPVMSKSRLAISAEQANRTLAPLGRSASPLPGASPVVMDRGGRAHSPLPPSPLVQARSSLHAPQDVFARLSHPTGSSAAAAAAPGSRSPNPGTRSPTLGASQLPTHGGVSQHHLLAAASSHAAPVDRRSPEDALLESLASDPSFAALRDSSTHNDSSTSQTKMHQRSSSKPGSKDHSRTNSRTNSPTVDGSRRRASKDRNGSPTQGGGGGGSPVTKSSRRASLKDQALLHSLVPDFAAEMTAAQRAIEASRSAVQDTNGTRSRRGSQSLSASPESSPQSSNLSRSLDEQPWPLLDTPNVAPIERHTRNPECFAAYTSKLVSARQSVALAVESSKFTTATSEGLAFLSLLKEGEDSGLTQTQQSRLQTHVQAIFEAGFEAGVAAAKKQQRDEIEAAALAARGVEKEKPKIRTDQSVMSPSGVVVVESVRSP